MTQDGISFKMLIIKAQEGRLSDEDRECLNEFLKSPENRKTYFEMIKVNCALMQFESSDYLIPKPAVIRSSFDQRLWEELANEEKVAPSVELTQREMPTAAYVGRLEPYKMSFRINRGALITFVLSAAAMLLFIFLVQIAPKQGVEVATLTDSLNAQWGNIGGSMEKGRRIVTGRAPVQLQGGLAQLQFDTNAHLTIEAPAEFQVLGEDHIRLNYGRVYATVPPEAIGFTVTTSSARIIDLGTEFGVEADSRGDTYLHVMQGKTILIGGGRNNKVGMEVTKGMAKKAIAGADSISDISWKEFYFVRAIDSGSGSAWRGHTEINLADIVGGGNGFGTGKLDWAIDPLTGSLTNICEAFRKTGQSKYVPVTGLDFIDGVFTLSARPGTVVVSSEGHLFTECPETSGQFWGGIVNGAKVVQHAEVLPYTDFKHQGTLKEVPVGTLQNPAIFMEPNMGITFNLDKIRTFLPEGLKIKSFGSLCGLCDSDEITAKSDFWILVDGKIRDSHIGVRSNENPLTSRVPLTDHDRYLTFVVTDNDGNLSRDWCLFARPTLYLESIQE